MAETADGKKLVYVHPRLLDLFSGEGGAARGYADAGFEVTGIDLSPEMAYEYAEKAGRNADTAAKQAVQIAKRYPGRFIAADALSYLAEHWTEYDAFHASPPCQRYSTMANLPWIKPNHDALILATREAFQRIHAESGRPWVIENVEGARWGAKGLAKRGLEAHGMQAGFLCGAMFGLRMYRHRLFETSFLWLAPEHPKHRFRQGMPGFEAEHPGESQQAAQMVDAPFNGHDDTPFWKRGQFIEHASIKTRTELRKLPGQVRAAAGIIDGEVRKASLAAKQQGNGAQGVGVGVGHAAGWRLAAEAMGCAWMDRYGLTQAVPPRFTAWLGERLMKAC